MLREKTRSYFKREFQLDDKDVQELIDAATSTLTESLADLGYQFSSNADVIRIKEAAHALKGNLMNMGLDQQARQAMVIEQSLNGNLADAEKTFRELQAELESF